MDDQPSIHLPARHRTENLVVPELDDLAQIGCREPQKKERGGLRAGDRDPT